MSVERPFEAWEEVQRHGQDLADRLAEGFNGLIQTPFSWPNSSKSKLFDQSCVPMDFGLVTEDYAINGVSAIFDIGSRIGQVGADFGASLNGLVQQFYRILPVPYKQEEGDMMRSVLMGGDMGSEGIGIGIGIMAMRDDLGSLSERLKNEGYTEDDNVAAAGTVDEEGVGFNIGSNGILGMPQMLLVIILADQQSGVEPDYVSDRYMILLSAFIGEKAEHHIYLVGDECKIKETINLTTTYNSRTQKVESSLSARGDLWRVEASHGSSTSGNENSSLFLAQLGPLLLVRDSSLLLPVHLSKQHLLWYGYDRKNGMHSLCPAVWSKDRRWLLMSMLCVNPLACTFVDLQFPNGQLTYVSGEGLTTSAFLPVCGGLLQAQGQYPGEMRYSFSCKNNWGTRITPMIQWPDKSFSLSLDQSLAWQRSGLIVRPTVQFSVCPTFGGSNPGFRAELLHSVKEKLNLTCGCALTMYPSAFASICIGRSKWNGSVGNSGLVLRVDSPLSNVGCPSFSVQINSGIEF